MTVLAWLAIVLFFIFLVHQFSTAEQIECINTEEEDWYECHRCDKAGFCRFKMEDDEDMKRHGYLPDEE